MKLYGIMIPRHVTKVSFRRLAAEQVAFHLSKFSNTEEATLIPAEQLHSFPTNGNTENAVLGGHVKIMATYGEIVEAAGWQHISATSQRCRSGCAGKTASPVSTVKGPC